MILDEITLHDFGVYGGRQTMVLKPETRGRPITLVGGLNGGGKTTLLDALQVALFGQAARSSNRRGLSYDEYLRRSIHRGADRPEAALELAFRHTSDGVEHRFRVHRSWSATNGGVRERFHVLHDDRLDRVATEHWAEQVEAYLPSRIAHLFFFDGEKVESYADLEEAPALIGAAIHNLLGLDLVERLVSDLQILERRHRVAAKPEEDRAELDALQSRIRTSSSTRDGLVAERAQLATALDRATANLARAEARFRQDGGTLYEQRAALEARLRRSEEGLAGARRTLGEIAAGGAPLRLVEPLLRGMAARDAAEGETRRAREVLHVLSEEYEALLVLPAVAALRPGEQAALRGQLQIRAEDRRDAAGRPTPLAMGEGARRETAALLEVELPELGPAITAALAREEEARHEFEAARDVVLATPGSDAVASVSELRDRARAELDALGSRREAVDGELARLERELEALRASEERLVESGTRARFEGRDVERILGHSSRVRSTLGRFRDAVVVRHVSRIEQLVLESFRQLVRKEGLVTGLSIDPSTFALELRGRQGDALTPDRLSAGERQLLAIAILWGLARASGRPLPTVIDTPLGRLDSLHRNHVVNRYFPHASHQVILLSTDEEITAGHLDALAPSIERTYRLRFDGERDRTVIEPGYFGDERLRGDWIGQRPEIGMADVA